MRTTTLLLAGVSATAVSTAHAGILDSIKSAVGMGPSGMPPGQKAAIGGDYTGKSKEYEESFLPKNAPGVPVANFADLTLPPIEQGGRVVDLMNGWQFDDVLRDTPDEMRPPSLVAFYDSSDQECMKRYTDLEVEQRGRDTLPARERLFVSKYDMFAAPRRAWYKFTPEMDLQARFKVSECPTLVYAPRECNGWTKWCVQGKAPDDELLEVIGCKDFKEQCTNTVKWNKKGKWVDWVQKLIADESEGEPSISPFFKTYKEQGRWIRGRESTTANTHVRNTYLAQGFPSFTPTGLKAMQTPKVVQDFLVDFHKKYEKKRRTEFWDAESTQLNFHENITTFVDMDLVRHEKEKIANKIMKPIVAEWSKMDPLELTSFYGMREYSEGAWLREHIDRIDTHVLSVTFSVAKHNQTPESKPWPLQVVAFNGDIVRYDHPAGTMVLYESSKLPHGRPERNMGGVHLGAFCHFKPLVTDKLEAAAWDDISKRARAFNARHVKHVSYGQTKTVEPVNPKFTAKEFAKNTRWKHDGEKGAERSEPSSLSITLKNKSNRPLEVYWDGQDGAVPQGVIAPGSVLEINSYDGHKFFWSGIDKGEALPAGRFQIDAGKRTYEYALMENATSGKWKKVVEDKFASKEEQAEEARLQRLLKEDQ